MQSMVQEVYRSAEILLKKPHFHDCHQIILISKGDVEFCVNGNYFTAGAGNIAIFSRYENHSVRVKSEEYERYVLHIDPTVVNRKSPVYALLTDRPVGFLNIIDTSSSTGDIIDIFEHLIYEHNSVDKFTDEMEQLLVKQLLIVIYRCTNLYFDGLQDDIVTDVKRQFENNYSEQYSLEKLARQYNISVSSLSHRFRSVTGTSVMEYLQSCRIAHAKRMFADADSNIGEIVQKCGFSDSSNFSRTFKKLNGMSPTDFRKKYRAE